MPDARYPGRASIDAYGNGGFRFADMSHVGSLLLLPDGMHAWNVSRIEDLTEASLERVIEQAAAIDFLLLGTGERQLFPRGGVCDALARAGIGIEVMDTGAAARTWNVLLVENRAVAAALIAVA